MKKLVLLLGIVICLFSCDKITYIDELETYTQDTIIGVYDDIIIEDTIIEVVEDTIVEVVVDTIVEVVVDTIVEVVVDTIVEVLEDIDYTQYITYELHPDNIHQTTIFKYTYSTDKYSLSFYVEKHMNINTNIITYTTMYMHVYGFFMYDNGNGVNKVICELDDEIIYTFLSPSTNDRYCQLYESNILYNRFILTNLVRYYDLDLNINNIEVTMMNGDITILELDEEPKNIIRKCFKIIR